jgi:hypothetical protein
MLIRLLRARDRHQGRDGDDAEKPVVLQEKVFVFLSQGDRSPSTACVPSSHPAMAPDHYLVLPHSSSAVQRSAVQLFSTGPPHKQLRILLRVLGLIQTPTTTAPYLNLPYLHRETGLQSNTQP